MRHLRGRSRVPFLCDDLLTRTLSCRRSSHAQRFSQLTEAREGIIWQASMERPRRTSTTCLSVQPRAVSSRRLRHQADRYTADRSTEDSNSCRSVLHCRRNHSPWGRLSSFNTSAPQARTNCCSTTSQWFSMLLRVTHLLAPMAESKVAAASASHSLWCAAMVYPCTFRTSVLRASSLAPCQKGTAQPRTRQSPFPDPSLENCEMTDSVGGADVVRLRRMR